MTRQPFANPTLLLILLVAALMRMISSLTAPLEIEQLSGGDSIWYLANGIGLLSGEQTGIALGMKYDVSVLPTAPLYLVFVGLWVQLLPLNIALVIVRLLQVCMSVAVCYFGYDIARRLTDDQRVGTVAAAVLAFAPAWVLEARYVLTETLYIFFVVGGLWAYVRTIDRGLRWPWLTIAALLLALATLTRAVALLYPLGLAVLLVLTLRTQWRTGLAAALLFILVYAAGVSTWTVYNWLAYERFVIASDQFMPALWRGAIETDASPQTNDELIGDSSHGEQAAAVISADLTGFVGRRVAELVNAFLQPHGTTHLGGASLKDMAQDWIRSGFSPGGLQHLITGEGFWPKLLIYLWHYGGLLFGVVGMWLACRRWPITLALVGFMVYTTLLHLVILALPRYIFPAMPFFWMLSAVTLVRLWDAVRGKASQRGMSDED